MIEQYGEVKYFDGKQMHKREMTDEELKCMMGHIQLNRGFSLPDQLLNDFMISKPTMKNCIHFNKTDFKNIVEPLKHKNIRKSYPKIKSKKMKKNNKDKQDKQDKQVKQDKEENEENEKEYKINSKSPNIKKKKTMKKKTIIKKPIKK